MTEKEYRALPYDSYSSFKVFSEDRKEYYKKFVEGIEDKKEETPRHLVMGSLVDTLLFTPKEFDDRFAMALVQPPTGQMADFTQALYRRSVESMDGDGKLLRGMEVLSKEAYNDVKYDRNGNIVAFKRKGDSYEGVFEKFTEGNAELYYRQLISCHGKEVVELIEVQSAEKLVAELKRNWITKDIINTSTNKDKEVYNQLIIIFEYKGHMVKAMIDKLIIDHIAKKIYIFDLKTCWNNEKEFQGNWFKYRYYLQGAVYYLATLWWADKEGWKDYIIVPMQFIVVDTLNQRNPLIYPTDSINLQQGLEGFVLRGKYYMGVDRIINDIKWHNETSIWDMSLENYENQGIVKIKPFIEDEY